MQRFVYHFYPMVLMSHMYIYLKVHLFVLNKEKLNMNIKQIIMVEGYFMLITQIIKSRSLVIVKYWV